MKAKKMPVIYSLGERTSFELGEKFRKDIIRVGDIVRSTAGIEIKITTERINNWINNFNLMLERDERVPVVRNHSDKVEDVVGRVLSLQLEDTTLFAEVELEEEGTKLINNPVSLLASEFRFSNSDEILPEAILHLGIVQRGQVSSQGQFQKIAAIYDYKYNLSAINVEPIPEFMYNNNTVRKDHRMKLQELVTKSRKLELQYLVREGRLTPAIATRLEAIWCSEDVLKLSTEHNEVDSLFDQTLEALKELPTIIELGEKSNSQVIALRQNQGEEQLESPIIRSAKLMAEKAYNKNGVK